MAIDSPSGVIEAKGIIHQKQFINLALHYLHVKLGRQANSTVKMSDKLFWECDVSKDGVLKHRVEVLAC